MTMSKQYSGQFKNAEYIFLYSLNVNRMVDVNEMVLVLYQNYKSEKKVN